MSGQSIFTADPFSDSKQEIDIRSHELGENFSTEVSSDEKLFQPKCSSIAYMKTDQVPSAAGSLIATSAKYVCYVLKDKLVRVINRTTGQKCLLKHHSERITQIKFSSKDDSVLCTADAGTGSHAHVYIIQLVESDTDVESIVLQELTFPVSFIRPSPIFNRSFVFAHDNIVAFYHSRSEDLIPFAAMSTLPHVELPHSNIVDLAISRDGTRICALCRDTSAASGSTLTLHALAVHVNPATQSCILQTITHLNATPVPSPLFSGPFCALLANDQVLVGATDLANRDARTLRLQAWTTIGPPRCTQSITVTLPAAPGTDNAVLCDADPTGRFLVMADEATPIALIFAVNPEKRQAPLNYLSVSNLSLPLLSLATLTVKGQEHYSDEEVEHLEINCYQFQSSPQQLVVQQFFVPTSLCTKPQGASGEMNGHSQAAQGWEAGHTSHIAPSPLVKPSQGPALDASFDLLQQLRQGSTPPPGPIAPPAPAPAPAPASAPASASTPSHHEQPGRSLLQLLGVKDDGASPSVAIQPQPDEASPTLPATSTPAASERPSAVVTAKSKQRSGAAAAKTSTSPAVSAPTGDFPTTDFDNLRELIKEERPRASPQPAPQAGESEAVSGSDSAAAFQFELREQTKLIKAQSNALKQMPDATQKVVKSAVETATKKLAKDFAQATRAAIVEVNQQDLEPKLEEMIFRAVRETFQRSLIPAIEASVERMFSQIEDSVKVVVEKTQQTDSAKLDALSAQVQELTDTIRRMEAAQAAGAVAPAPAAPVARPFTFEELRGWLQDEHRVSDAFEAALESRNVALLEQLCEIAKPRDVIANCSQAILLCIVQQLSVGLPELSQAATEEAAERLNLRSNWLKQCTMRLDARDKLVAKHLGKVRATVEQAVRHLQASQPHLDQLAMDLQMLTYVMGTLLGGASR